MSLAFAIFSIVMMTIVFATGAYVGYCAWSGTVHDGCQEAPPPEVPEPGPPAVERLVHELRSLVDRLEERVREHELRAAPSGRVERASAGQTPPSTSEREAAPNESGVHLARGPQDDFVERRSKKRHTFTVRQWIAPYDGCELPSPGAFVNVQCCDISSGGMSFYLEHRPNFQMVVVRLAGAIETKFLTARIQRVEVSDDPPGFIVGCRFLGTLHSHALPARLNTVISDREERLLYTPQTPAMTPVPS